MLRLLSEGLSDKQIAPRLGMSQGGLNRRVKAAFDLAGGAHTRHGAVGNAYRMGILKVDESWEGWRGRMAASSEVANRARAELERLAGEESTRGDGARTRAYRKVAQDLLWEIGHQDW